MFVGLLYATSATAFTIAERGKALCVIIQAADATAVEKSAAAELAGALKEITGASFDVIDRAPASEERAILVGGGAQARKYFPDVPFDQLGSEELVIQSKPRLLILAGGAPRGTLYAVSRFLQDECGVRWWTPWASHIPARPTLEVRELSLRDKPAFEYREPYWMPAFDAKWSARNFCNGQSAHIPATLGGCIRYKGFVHTFYSLVPPTNFSAHPDWFSMVKAKRTTNYAQLCLTNPQLRDRVVARVKEWLRESPDARIVSVSQNDWHGWCECESCKAVDDREGSHAGTMLEFVNYIAGKIEPEFPDVAVDTLAYQYTRKPPRTARPRPNVIVRLCSIECDFREPFGSAHDNAANAAFAQDIRGWADRCDRLYIWDYSTDFGHYVQPHPNWFVLGPDLRFFEQHHVHGVFSEGAYQSHGSEMAELRAWVLARLMWNPQRDGRALIREFVNGYYGTNAAPAILQYLDLMHEASRGHNLTCGSRIDAPFLAFEPLARAEALWRQAEEAAAADPELLARVRVGHLPVQYVFLQRWAALRKQCDDANAAWPLPESRKQFADEFSTAAKGVAGKPWTRVTLMNESRLTLDDFLKRFAHD